MSVESPSVLAIAPAVQCTSAIVAVVVHARGAVVTRRVRVSGAPENSGAGDVECVVTDVTAAADLGSARVRVTRGARHVVGVRGTLHFPERAGERGDTAERLAKLERELRRLEDERDSLRRREERHANWYAAPVGRKRLEVLGPAFRVRTSLELARIVGERRRTLAARALECDAAIEALQRRIDAARLEDAQTSDRDRQGTGQPTARFVVHFTGDGALEEFELSYVVHNARWWPAYTVRLSDSGRRAELALEAYVAQNSGEDWRDVTIALSTAALSYDASLPKLASLRLGRAQTPRPTGYREPPEGLERLFGSYDQAMGALTAQTERAAREAAFEIPARHAAYTTHARSTPPTPPTPPVSPAPAPPVLQQAPPPAPPPPDIVDSFDEAESDVAFDARMPAPMMSMAAPPPAPRAGGAASFDDSDTDESMLRAKRRSVPRARATPPRAPTPSPASAQTQAPPGPSAIEPEANFLDFDALVLAGAGEARRGRLRVATKAARPGASFDVESAARALALVAPDVSSGTFDYRYDGDAIVEVPSDGRLHRITVRAGAADAELVLRCVPRKDEAVYREARFENPFDTPLLAGTLNVYSEGQFVSASTIERGDVGAVITVGLGVEERIKVARNARAAEEAAGLLGGKRTVVHEVDVELRSSLGFATRVEIVERIPVTDDEHLQVELVSERPKSAPYDQASLGAPVRGGRRWLVELEPGASARVNYAYRIILKAKDELVGGNRRE